MDQYLYLCLDVFLHIQTEVEVSKLHEGRRLTTAYHRLPLLTTAYFLQFHIVFYLGTHFDTF